MESRFWQQMKNVYHAWQSHWWRMIYGWPDRQLKMYGVTGTNGKTTTCLVLGHILRVAHGKEKVGLLSTEVFWFGEKEEVNVTHMTSTDARVVFRILRRMVDQGVKYVVIEMTSHALDQNRLAGIRLAGAIITNITSEHMDYHKTMEGYSQAKLRIIYYLNKAAPLIINGDDEWTEKGLTKFQISNFKFPIRRFTRADARDVDTSLLGDFNKENVLAASLLAEAIGIDRDVITRVIRNVPAVPGRVEWINLDIEKLEIRNQERLPRVLIDFALTPDALDKLYKYVRGEVSGKIIAVFGAAGRRDREKRPKITAIVAQYADEIVLTQDEPYEDDEEQIYRELEKGLVDATIPWQRIEDRREAIRYALMQAGPRDAVVITGMGNYPVRMVGKEALPWRDKDVVLELLEELRHRNKIT